MKENLLPITNQFSLSGDVVDSAPLKKGHINDTYVVICKMAAGNSRRFILQKVNHSIFSNVPALMENIRKVTDHIKSKIGMFSEEEPDQTMCIVRTKKGGLFYQDAEGEYWRVYDFIEGCESFDQCTGTGMAFEAGRACGRFQRYLLDLSPADFFDTIPKFHDTPYRFEQLDAALAKDSAGRSKLCRPEIEFALSRRDIGGKIVKAIQSGDVPTRVAHNDPKINNILFSTVTGRGLAIVDLDTCMSGSTLYDFGDLARLASVSAAEDEIHLERVFIDMSYFESLVRGYLEEMKHNLVPMELELLPLSPRVVALELGVRFLTDYLSGDGYFKIHREKHNLDRARTQFKTVLSAEEHEARMKDIVHGVLRST